MVRMTLIVTILLLSVHVRAQQQDQLWSDFQNEQLHDTIRLDALGGYIWKVYLFNDTDSAFYFIEIMEDYAEKTGNHYYVLEAFNRRGIAYAVKGQNRVAVTVFEEGVSRAERMHQTLPVVSLIANFHNNLGNVFSGIGDFKNAIRSYRNSLRSMEKIDNKAGIGNALHNLAMIFVQQSEYETAMQYYRLARKNHLLAGNKLGYANGAQNLGSLFQKVHKRSGLESDLDSAKLYLDSAVIYFNELGQKLGLANSYNALSVVAERKKDSKKSIEYEKLALELYLEINDPTGIASTYSNLSKLFLDAGDVKEAMEFANQAIFYSNQSDQFNAKKAANNSLMLIYRQQGNYKKALEVYENIVALNDSIINRELKDELIRNKFEYELESARLKDSLERLEERRIAQQQIELQTIQIENARVKSIGLYTVLFLLLAFIVFVYNRLKTSQKQQKIISQQKVEVEHQKQLVEGKNKEIVDSINYSKRLQDAILPKKSDINRVFEQNFILYRPKDIVSGDFYWFEETKNYYFVAAADCTGHGVPGAMVSFVCSQALSKAVKEDYFYDTSAILDRTREIVTNYFGRSENTISDGMDVALIRFEKSNMFNLQFSGANSCLYLLRDSELTQYKGDKQYIGQSGPELPFESKDIELEPQDELYLFTDGFPDQFGGQGTDPFGKKIKTKKLKTLLVQDTFDQKHRILEDFFDAWKGDREQTDDVLIMGIRL
jgi:serine phosphatase RsbU (regulator of sigma subunit)